MPPETAMMVAQKALEAARDAKTAALITAAQVEGVRAEVRGNFVNLEQRQTDFWGTVDRTLKLHTDLLRGQNEVFDAFKSDLYVDIDRLESGRKKHHNALFGDPERRDDPGALKTIETHDGHISRGLWMLGVITSLATAFWAYMLIFHLEEMKRGIFNTTEEEQVRIINRQILKMVPGAKWPAPDPIKPPERPNG